MSRFHESVHGVYFDDLDPFGILHNARYLLLFERTIGSFWQHVGLGGLQNNPDHHHLVRANYVEYLSPITGTGQVRVRVWIERLGETSLTFGFRLMPMDEDVDAARGTRTVVRIDPGTRRPTPWSPDLRRVMAAWLPKEAS